MKRYLQLYWHIFTFTLKASLEFRLNFMVKLLYAPAYIGVLLMIMLLAYRQAPSLGGWSKDESLLLFSTFNVVYGLALATFMNGIRDLLLWGIRMGEVDRALTKPANAQFLLTFSRPTIELMFINILMLVLFVRQLSLFTHLLELANVVLFLGLVILAEIIVYLTVSTYATVGFQVSRALQIIEFFDKTTDYSMYPHPIFPTSIKLLSVTVIPMAFFSYVPVSVLLNKADWKMVIGMIMSVPILWTINQFAWREGLKRYSSASS